MVEARSSTIAVLNFDIVGVAIASFDVEDKAELVRQNCVLEKLSNVASPDADEAKVQIFNDGRCEGKWNGDGRAVCALFAQILDLLDRSFDEAKTVAVCKRGPASPEVIDQPRSDSKPVELEMKARVSVACLLRTYALSGL